MANVRGKSIDNTHLSIDVAEQRGFIHRDYIAHCLRWSHVIKNMQRNYASAKILDIGCGKDVPLAKSLYSSRLIVKHYIGIDWNHHHTFDLSPFHTGKFPIDTFGRVDFASDNVWFDNTDDGLPGINIRGENREDFFYLPNTLVSFEVMEHIEPAHVRAMLIKARTILNLSRAAGESPVFYLSTPNYDENVGAAGNHVNEMRHDALGWLIEECGLQIQAEHGTFASMRDYKHKLFSDYEGSQKLFDNLADYYDVNYLATIFAPLYPVEARNCLWTLGPTPRVQDQGRRYDKPSTEDGRRWTSSDKWREMFEGYETSYDPTRGPE